MAGDNRELGEEWKEREKERERGRRGKNQREKNGGERKRNNYKR